MKDEEPIEASTQVIFLEGVSPYDLTEKVNRTIAVEERKGWYFNSSTLHFHPKGNGLMVYEILFTKEYPG